MSSGILPNDRADPYSRPHGSATLLPTPTPPAPDSCLLEKTPTDFSQTPNSQLASPQSTTPSSGKATHICDQCARAFSRAEHLERHQTTHLPSNATKSFVCTSCGKGFTRKDVLTRHIRAVHETKKPDVRKSRRKSCRRCAAFKIKCTGGGKGKQSGDRAAEACEACRKREVECIFDFGVTVGGGDMQDDEQAGDIFDYGSEDARSDPETACSEYSTKRRKTIHTSSGTPTYLSASTSGTTSAVSSHLLSAARLASSQTNQSERQLSDSVMQLPDQALELSSADHLLSMATFANKGLQIPETDRRSFSHRPMPREPPGPSAGYGHDPMSHLYFPPMRDSGSNRKPENEGAMVNRIAEEDLNAANTLQGINPAPSTMMSLNYRSGLDGPWKNNMVDDTNAQAGGTVRPLDMSGIMSRNFSTDYSNTGNAYFRSPMFGSSSLPPLSGAVEANSGQNGESSGLGVPGDGLSLEAGLDLPDDDSFFFDFNIFDNSTDWLRDWGPNESISPESHAGMDGLDILETLPDATFGIGLTPNYGGDYMGGSLQPFTPGPPATPGPAPEEPVESTPKPHHLSIGEDGRVPPPGIQVPGLPTASPSKDHSGNAFLPWGWQHGSGLKEDPGRKVTLPPLRHVLPERSNENESQQYGQIPAGTQVFDEDGVITEGMRKEMIHVLTLPSARPPYPRFETSEIERAFPTKEVIATFIKLYFDQFHPILPVIHRPTFCIEKCPSILLLAMISIGASYSNLKHSKAFADSLSELCKRYLAWMVR